MADNKRDIPALSWSIEKESDGSIRVYKPTKGSETTLHMSAAVVQKMLEVDKLFIAAFVEKGDLKSWRHDLGGLTFITIHQFSKDKPWYIDLRKYYVNNSCQIHPTKHGVCLSLEEWPHFLADFRLAIAKATPADVAYQATTINYCDLLTSPIYSATLDFLVNQLAKSQSCAACENDEPGQEGHSCLDEAETLRWEPVWNEILQDRNINTAYIDTIRKLLLEWQLLPETLNSILAYGLDIVLDLPKYMIQNEGCLRRDLIQAGFALDPEKASKHEPLLPSLILSLCQKYAFQGVEQRKQDVNRSECLNEKTTLEQKEQDLSKPVPQTEKTDLEQQKQGVSKPVCLKTKTNKKRKEARREKESPIGAVGRPRTKALKCGTSKDVSSQKE